MQEYASRNSGKILSDLVKEGALLFRGFDIESPNEAVAILKQMQFTDSGCCETNQRLTVGTRDPKYLNTDPLSMFMC